MPVPSSQSSPSGFGSPPPAAKRLLDAGRGIGRARSCRNRRRTGPSRPTRSSRRGGSCSCGGSRTGRCPSEPRQIVDRAFDGEGRLRRAVAAEAAARHHVGVDGVADRPSCWRSDRRRAGCRARRQASRRRGRHRRRCWRRREPRSRSACRRVWRRASPRVVIWWRVVAPMNCSSRVNSHFTGRPVFSVASTQRSSVIISCLPPKPPPTRSVKTCTSRAAQRRRYGRASAWR